MPQRKRKKKLKLEKGEERTSICCGAKVLGEYANPTTDGFIGICADCREWSEFLTEDELENYLTRGNGSL